MSNYYPLLTINLLIIRLTSDESHQQLTDESPISV